MNETFIKQIYKNTKGLDKFKGYLVFSCDGTELKLQNVEKTKQEFKININHLLNKYLSRARVSCIVDSKSQLIIDVKLVEKIFSK